MDLTVGRHVVAVLASASLAVPSSVASPPAQDGSLPPVEQILAKVETRIGDVAKRTQLKSLLMRGRISVPEAAGDGAFEEAWLGSDRARQRVDWGGEAAMEQGTTGAFSWSTDPALGVTIREGDEQASVQRMFALGRRAPWREMYASAQTLGLEAIEDLGGRKHFKLAMKPAIGEPETWFVDAETWDLDAVELTLPDPTGGTFPVRFVFTDHREVKGIRFPHQKTMKVGKMAIAYRYESIEPDAAVKPEQVAPGAAVLEALKDPSKRAKQSPADATECKVEEVTAQPTLSVRLKIQSDQVSRTLAVVLPEVVQAITKGGGEMAGPPFSRYHAFEDGTIDFEAGIPVKKKIEGRGRVQASELPAGKVAVTWHVGPYDGLPRSCERLKEWIAAKALTPRGGHWEVYFTDPGIEPDPTKWRTQLLWPIE